MNSGTMWRSHKSGLSLGRAIFLAMMLHLLCVFVLVIADFVPPYKKKTLKFFVKGTPGVIGIQFGSKVNKPKGIQRKVDVANPSPPVPKPVAKAKPKPNKPVATKPVVPPKKVVQKPEAKKVAALPPVKTNRKVIKSSTKKALATPPPKEKEEVEENSKEEIKETKENIKDSPPDLADAPLPSLPSSASDLPKIEAKGDPDGGPGVGAGLGGGLPSIGSGEGIELPGSYLADAFARISSNFNYPSYYQNQLKSPVFCTIGFRVMLDGKIADIKVEKTSGDPALDRFAMVALEKTIALLPLKPYITQDIGKDYLGASVPFVFGGAEQQL